MHPMTFKNVRVVNRNPMRIDKRYVINYVFFMLRVIVLGFTIVIKRGESPDRFPTTISAYFLFSVSINIYGLWEAIKYFTTHEPFTKYRIILYNMYLIVMQAHNMILFYGNFGTVIAICEIILTVASICEIYYVIRFIGLKLTGQEITGFARSNSNRSLKYEYFIRRALFLFSISTISYTLNFVLFSLFFVDIFVSVKIVNVILFIITLLAEMFLHVKERDERGRRVYSEDINLRKTAIALMVFRLGVLIFEIMRHQALLIEVNINDPDNYALSTVRTIVQIVLFYEFVIQLILAVEDYKNFGRGLDNFYQPRHFTIKEVLSKS